MLFLKFTRSDKPSYCENPRCEKPIKKNSIKAIARDTQLVRDQFKLCGKCGSDLESLRDSINKNQRLDHENLIDLIQEASQIGNADRKEQAEIDRHESFA
jgi:hypothetical protein